MKAVTNQHTRSHTTPGENIVKITLATHIVVEHVGNQVFLLDSVGKEVYCLPAEGITHYSSKTKTLVVTSELVPEVTRLVDSGVATTTGLISRRAVVGSTGALIGGGLVAMSMPAAAASQSPGPGGDEGINPPGGQNFDFFASGVWRISASDPSDRVENIDIDILIDGNPLTGDEKDWVLTIFGVPYTLGPESEDVTFGFDSDDNQSELVIEDLFVNFLSDQLNTLKRDFCDLGLDGLEIVALLTDGEVVGQVTLRYDMTQEDFEKECPLSSSA